jgi:hypothetical protein
VPGEPLHVSTGGGGEKLETGLAEQSTRTSFIAVRPGFAYIALDRRSLAVAMMDRNGNAAYRATRTR